MGIGSSAGQSIRLLSGRSQVRVLPNPSFSKFSFKKSLEKFTTKNDYLIIVKNRNTYEKS